MATQQEFNSARDTVLLCIDGFACGDRLSDLP